MPFFAQGKKFIVYKKSYSPPLLVSPPASPVSYIQAVVWKNVLLAGQQRKRRNIDVL